MNSNHTTSRLSVRLPKDHLRQLQMIAAKTGAQNVSEVVRNVIEKFLSDPNSVKNERDEEILAAIDEVPKKVVSLQSTKVEVLILEAIALLIEHVFIPILPANKKVPLLAFLQKIKGE